MKKILILIDIQNDFVDGAQLSDSPGKAMCSDPDYLEYLKRSVAFRLGREGGNA